MVDVKVEIFARTLCTYLKTAFFFDMLQKLVQTSKHEYTVVSD